MGKDKKEKKERKRSRSRSRERKHKKDKKKRRDSSSSSSSSEDADTKFQSQLDRERAQKKLQRKLEKQRLKDQETPEEKRARRLAKKAAKELKRKKEGGYLPPELQYTNTNNPFNDVRLTETFVWNKKLQREGKTELSTQQIEKETRRRVEKNLREMEELKRARDARIAAREDMDMIQRDLDRRLHGEWTEKEAKMQLEQAKVRSQLRIEQNRAKPIDLLSRYILYGDDIQDEKDRKSLEEFELEEPSTYVRGLEQGDYEDLLEDIKVYRELEGEKHLAFWSDIKCLVDDELEKIKGDRAKSSVHASVQKDVISIFKDKTVDQLLKLEDDLVHKVRSGNVVNVSFYEAMLDYLRVHISKTRLRELHQNMLKLKLKRIREEQMKEMGSADEVHKKHGAMKPSTSSVKTKVEVDDDDDEDTEELEKKVRKKANIEELDNPELDDQERELKWKALTVDQLENATLELYERGCYSPAYGDVNDTMPGIEVLEEDVDRQSLMERRKQHRKMPTGASAAEAAMLAIARKGMEGDEATFSVEAPLETQSYLWSDKYRPRKPTYLNRVQTGFDWNKYNQTHYDMDNPPPKIVQGYKFNIFYPDLLDKRKTPSFQIFPCDDPDFAEIRFSAGPPYEDIAFKIVHREWEISHRNGYKCQFQNGVFQLWFQFKKYRYRR